MYAQRQRWRKSLAPHGGGSELHPLADFGPARTFQAAALGVGRARTGASAAGRATRINVEWRFSLANSSRLATKSATTGFSGGIANGIWVDQQIAKKVGGTTKFKSLEFGVQLGGADVMHRMSYLDANQPLPPDEDPSSAFNRIFSELSEGGVVSPAVRKHRATVLDAVAADYARLSPRLGAADSAKIDQHLS